MDALPDDVVAKVVMASVPSAPMKQRFRTAMLFARTSKRMFRVVTCLCPDLWESLLVKGTTPASVRQLRFVTKYVVPHTVRRLRSLWMTTHDTWAVLGDFLQKHPATLERLEIGIDRQLWPTSTWTEHLSRLSEVRDLRIIFYRDRATNNYADVALPSMRKLTSMILEFDEGTVTPLLAILATPQPALCQLNIRANGYVSEQPSLWPSLVHHTRLQTLRLQLGPADGAQILDDAACPGAAGHLHSVTHVDIEFRYVHPSAYAFLTHCTALRDLHMVNGGIFAPTSPVLPCLPPTLTSLSLERVRLDAECTTLSALTELRDLRLADCFDVYTLRGLAPLKHLTTMDIEDKMSLRCLDGLGRCTSLVSLRCTALNVEECGDFAMLQGLRVCVMKTKYLSRCLLPWNVPSFTRSLRTLHVDVWTCTHLSMDVPGVFPALRRLLMNGSNKEGAAWLLESAAVSGSPLLRLEWPCDPGVRFGVQYPRAAQLLVDWMDRMSASDADADAHVEAY